MKRKVLCLLLAVVFALSLAACGKKSEPVPSSATTGTARAASREERIISLVENYDYTGTKGFDYSAEQTENGAVVNRHTVSVRLDGTNGTVGSWIEYIKTPNADSSGEQYAESTSTAYYRNGKIGLCEDGVWTWEDGSLDEFFTVRPDFRFNLSTLRNLSVGTVGAETILTFRVDDASASSLLGISTPVKNLSFEIKADAALERLVSFSLKYSQEPTVTEIRFVPYVGSVSITLPD